MLHSSWGNICVVAHTLIITNNSVFSAILMLQDLVLAVDRLINFNIQFFIWSGNKWYSQDSALVSTHYFWFLNAINAIKNHCTVFFFK